MISDYEPEPAVIRRELMVGSHAPDNVAAGLVALCGIVDLLAARIRKLENAMPDRPGKVPTLAEVEDYVRESQSAQLTADQQHAIGTVWARYIDWGSE